MFHCLMILFRVASIHFIDIIWLKRNAVERTAKKWWMWWCDIILYAIWHSELVRQWNLHLDKISFYISKNVSTLFVWCGGWQKMCSKMANIWCWWNNTYEDEAVAGPVLLSLRSNIQITYAWSTCTAIQHQSTTSSGTRFVMALHGNFQVPFCTHIYVWRENGRKKEAHRMPQWKRWLTENI